MFQTLIIVASIVVLSGAILMSTIVSARNALHQVVVAKTQTAMNDATSQFQFWAQKFVAQNGTEADWNAADAQQSPIFQAMCATSIADCKFYETLQWKVTGATSGVPAGGAAGQPVSSAINMTQAIDEQRVSATITAVVSDARGVTLYGGRTEEVTARVFNVAPYVVVTGTRDAGSVAGSTKQAEGDSAGVDGRILGVGLITPAPTKPNAYTDTVVRATIDCSNTPLFSESVPDAPSDNATNVMDPSYRQGGTLAWAYQMPCSPTYGVPTAPPSTTNYSAPIGPVYRIDASNSNSSWQKGDADTDSFHR